MKSKFIFILIFLLIIFLLPNNDIKINADDLSDNINEQLDNIDFSQIENFINQNLDNQEFSNGFLFSIKQVLNGEFNLKYKDVFNNLLDVLFNSVNRYLPLLISAFIIAILCGIFHSTNTLLNNSSLKDIIFYACFSCVIVILLSVVSQIVNSVYYTIKNMTILIQIISPIMMTLMVACGGITSVSIYKPSVLFLTGGLSNLFLNILFPLVTFLIVLSVLINLSNEVKLERTHTFISTIIKWIVGVSVTVFSFFITIQGISAGISDGISLRTAKYTISNSVPLFGSFLSSGFDLVLAGSFLIKNAVGVASLILLFSLLLSPIINLCTIQLILKLFSAIAEPLTDKRFVSFSDSLSKTLGFSLAILLASAFMIFIVLILLICSITSIF